MKKIFVIAFATLAFMACSDSDGPSKSEARAAAMVDWTELGDVGQDIACSIYTDPGIDRSEILEWMTTDEKRTPKIMAEAKLDLLEENC